MMSQLKSLIWKKKKKLNHAPSLYALDSKKLPNKLNYTHLQNNKKEINARPSSQKQCTNQRFSTHHFSLALNSTALYFPYPYVLYARLESNYCLQDPHLTSFTPTWNQKLNLKMCKYLLSALYSVGLGGSEVGLSIDHYRYERRKDFCVPTAL